LTVVTTNYLIEAQVKPKPPKPAELSARKPDLHPRNQHVGRYDFAKLSAEMPSLAKFLRPNRFAASELTIDFADSDAVKTLNAALLKCYYGVQYWDTPPGYLCPPIPGRADYLHHAADLLAASNDNIIPRGDKLRVLDIGVGANCIYPLIGQHEYGWRFVGADVDRTALAAAQNILDRNVGLGERIALRRQVSPSQIFTGVVGGRDDRFDLVICNPPFHVSRQAAERGAVRKWKNLGKNQDATSAPTLNFGGQPVELWCDGGEAGFVGRMIAESASLKTQVLWFSALISSETTLPQIYAALKTVNATTVKTIAMAQGQKKSRIVAWTFCHERAIRQWWRTRLA
jgi:23S rRNA (adenine1618-N6)-methyltransferase